jgi:hypothetical protein
MSRSAASRRCITCAANVASLSSCDATASATADDVADADGAAWGACDSRVRRVDDGDVDVKAVGDVDVAVDAAVAIATADDATRAGMLLFRMSFCGDDGRPPMRRVRKPSLGCIVELISAADDRGRGSVTVAVGDADRRTSIAHRSPSPGCCTGMTRNSEQGDGAATRDADSKQSRRGATSCVRARARADVHTHTRAHARTHTTHTGAR